MEPRACTIGVNVIGDAVRVASVSHQALALLPSRLAAWAKYPTGWVRRTVTDCDVGTMVAIEWHYDGCSRIGLLLVKSADGRLEVAQGGVGYDPAAHDTEGWPWSGPLCSVGAMSRLMCYHGPSTVMRWIARLAEGDRTPGVTGPTATMAVEPDLEGGDGVAPDTAVSEGNGVIEESPYVL